MLVGLKVALVARTDRVKQEFSQYGYVCPYFE